LRKFKWWSLLALLLSSNSYAANQIPASEAPFHTGEDVVACGELVKVSRFKRGLYLNLDKSYPNQPLTLIVWEDDLAEFRERHGDLNNLVNHDVCGDGKVTKYKGMSQISLYNSYSLKRIK
jgi:hypothetical protein